MIRVSRRSLPSTPRVCTLANACVYRKGGLCDEPQINKGNGDAACHRASNKDVLKWLQAPPAAARAEDQQSICGGAGELSAQEGTA